MKNTTITVNESTKGSTTKVQAHRPDKKDIDLVSFFKPYYAKGLKLRKLFYATDTGFLKATLIGNN